MWRGVARVYVIGLTGNIATGKSTVGRMLADLGALYIDADEIAHDVIARGGAAFADVVAVFGAGILDANGEIDRRRLGDIVFADAARLRQLEEIVHPAVSVRILGTLASPGADLVVLDAIKLLESGLSDICDAVWVVTCPREQQLDRLVRTRGLSAEESLLRISAQPPQEEKARRANVVIDNGGSPARTRRQVKSAWKAARRQMAAKAGPAG
jgi:dephospho-CoA kinase